MRQGSDLHNKIQWDLWVSASDILPIFQCWIDLIIYSQWPGARSSIHPRMDLSIFDIRETGPIHISSMCISTDFIDFGEFNVFRAVSEIVDVLFKMVLSSVQATDRRGKNFIF